MSNGAPYPYEPPPRDQRHTAGGAGARTAAPRRSRARRLVPMAFAGWVVLEIWLLTLVAEAAGAVTVLALLAAGLVLGSLVVRTAGRRAWRHLSGTLHAAAGVQDPGEPAARRSGNSMTILGGLLLVIPGLASDVVGLLCLFPPTAALLRRAAGRRLASAGPGAAGGLTDAVRQARTAEEQLRVHRPDGRVVQGEVIRDDEGTDRG